MIFHLLEGKFSGEFLIYDILKDLEWLCTNNRNAIDEKSWGGTNAEIGTILKISFDFFKMHALDPEPPW